MSFIFLFHLTNGQKLKGFQFTVIFDERGRKALYWTRWNQSSCEWNNKVDYQKSCLASFNLFINWLIITITILNLTTGPEPTHSSSQTSKAHRYVSFKHRLSGVTGVCKAPQACSQATTSTTRQCREAVCHRAGALSYQREEDSSPWKNNRQQLHTDMSIQIYTGSHRWLNSRVFSYCKADRPNRIYHTAFVWWMSVIIQVGIRQISGNLENFLWHLKWNSRQRTSHSEKKLVSLQKHSRDGNPWKTLLCILFCCKVYTQFYLHIWLEILHVHFMTY